MGLCGIKGVPHSKKVTDDCDLIIALGARFAPTFCLGNPSTFAKNSFCVSINNDKDELNLNLKKVDLKINEDLDKFMPLFYKYIEKETFPDFKNWQKICSIRKKKILFQIYSIRKILLTFTDLCICLEIKLQKIIH